MRSITLVPASSSRFFCWTGVSAASTISSSASLSFGELGDLLDLALAEQGRGPDRAQPERLRRDDFDADRLGEPLRFLDPRLGRAPRALARQLGHDDDRPLAARDLGRAIAVEFVQVSPPRPRALLGARLSGCAGCRVEIACL